MIQLPWRSLRIASMVRVALVAALCVLLVAPADAKKKGGTVPMKDAIGACNRTAGCSYDTSCEMVHGVCSTSICTTGKGCVSCNDQAGTCPAVTKRGPTGTARAGGSTTLANSNTGSSALHGATKQPIGHIGAVRVGKH